jgi:hypothetical protein
MHPMLRGRIAVAWSLALSVLALLALAPRVQAAETPADKAPAAKAPVAKGPAVKPKAVHKPTAKAPAAKAPAAKTPEAKTAAAETPKLAGTWDAVAVTPQGELPVVVTIKIVAGQPKCDVEAAGVKQSVSEEKLDGEVLTMKVSYEFGVYDVTAKASGDTLDGTWQGGGYSGALKGTRRP